MRRSGLFGFVIIMSLAFYGERQLTASSFFCCLQEKKNDANTELQGKWKVVSQKENGETLAPELPLYASFHKNEVTYLFVDGFKDTTRFVLAPTKRPKHIDLHFLDEVTKKQKRILGIYELKDGKLKMCFSRADGKRPESFSADKGDQSYLDILEVEK